MNRAQQLLDEVFEARRKKPVPAQPAAPAAPPAQPLMSPEEMDSFVLTTLGYGDFINMLSLMDRYGLGHSGRVTRNSNHYVHERTTDFEWEVETYGVDMPPEDETLIGQLADTIQDTIKEEIVDINQKIYRALEREYDYQHSDEVVADNIRANEYEFDEEGNREDGGGFEYDQLDDSAKETARQWWNEADAGDNYFSEHIIEEWNTELEEMGFESPDISWSGFWSQGDGASFTCKGFDFRKYAQFFMSGKDKDRGHPYTDELFKDEPPPQPPQAQPVGEAEEDLGIDLDQFSREAVFNSFDVIGNRDPGHESEKRPGEKRHIDSKQSRDNKFFVRLQVYDSATDEKNGWVTVEVYCQAWEDTEDFHRKKAGGGIREVKFFVPPGTKSKLIAAVMDYWNNVKGIADRRDPAGRLKDPQSMCRSILIRLSRLAGLWKQEYLSQRQAAAKAQVDAYYAAHPEEVAKLEAWRAKQAERMAKNPGPSAEKLALRAEMKKWKAERDAAAAAVPPPQQESEAEDMLNQMGDVAVRGAVNIGSFMLDQPVRYMTGAQHFNWSKTTSCWHWKLDVDAYVYEDNLPNQPWDVSVRVHSCTRNMGTRRLERQFHREEEKNYFALNLQKFIQQMEEIVERGWEENLDQLLKEIEIAFNSTMVPRGLGRKIETFYQL